MKRKSKLLTALIAAGVTAGLTLGATSVAQAEGVHYETRNGITAEYHCPNACIVFRRGDGETDVVDSKGGRVEIHYFTEFGPILV